jgi:hypothetical protein
LASRRLRDRLARLRGRRTPLGRAGAKQSDPDHPNPNLVIADDLVPLVSKETGEIEYVVAHTKWDRLDAMTPVSG